MPTLFGDSANLPDDFKNMTKHLDKDTPWQEWVYASVLYVFFECGFTLTSTVDNQYCTTGQFNLQAMRHYGSVSPEELYRKSSSTFTNQICFGNSRCEVILHGSCSATSLSQYLVINVYLKMFGSIYSAAWCCKSSDFTITSKGLYSLKKTKELSITIRDILVTPIKNILLPRQNKAGPALHCMPVVVLNHICKFLVKDDEYSLLRSVSLLTSFNLTQSARGRSPPMLRLMNQI